MEGHHYTNLERHLKKEGQIHVNLSPQGETVKKLGTRQSERLQYNQDKYEGYGQTDQETTSGQRKVQYEVDNLTIAEIAP